MGRCCCCGRQSSCCTRRGCRCDGGGGRGGGGGAGARWVASSRLRQRGRRWRSSRARIGGGFAAAFGPFAESIASRVACPSSATCNVCRWARRCHTPGTEPIRTGASDASGPARSGSSRRQRCTANQSCPSSSVVHCSRRSGRRIAGHRAQVRRRPRCPGARGARPSRWRSGPCPTPRNRQCPLTARTHARSPWDGKEMAWADDEGCSIWSADQFGHAHCKCGNPGSVTCSLDIGRHRHPTVLAWP